MHTSLRRLRPLVDRPCELLIRGERLRAIVFDWSKVGARAQEAFVDELFGDWNGRGATFRALVSHATNGKRAKRVWSSQRYVPFALLNVDSGDAKKKFRGGASYPAFARLLLADVTVKGTPVVAVDVDGTAVATKTLPKIAASLDAIVVSSATAKRPTAAKTEAKARSTTTTTSATTDSSLAQELERVVDKLFDAMSDYRIGRHGIDYSKLGRKNVPPNKAKAAKALARCEALIARVTELTAKSELIATTLGAGGVASDYRALLTTLAQRPIDDRRWKSVGIDRFARDKQFFRSLHAELIHKAAGTAGWQERSLVEYAKKSVKR